MRNNSPPYLYHGSQALVDVLQPRTARGVGPEADQLCALYASHERHFAIPFAFPIAPNENGGYAWSMSFDNHEPRVMIEEGRLDLCRVGYLYRVPADTFEPIDEYQWISYEPVTPLDYEIIHPEVYAHWIVHERRT